MNRYAGTLVGRVVVAVAVICAATAVTVHSVSGPDLEGDEYQVKAAFLYTFAKFVQWPSTTGPLIIGVLGDDPFGSKLEDLVKGRNINGREVVIRKVGPQDDPTKYHVLFICPSEARRTPDILKLTSGAPVLTVGETLPFLREGGVVRFFVEGNRMRFQINADVAEKGGLKINSQLLSLAAK